MAKHQSQKPKFTSVKEALKLYSNTKLRLFEKKTNLAKLHKHFNTFLTTCRITSYKVYFNCN